MGTVCTAREAALLAWATDSGISMGLWAQPQTKIPSLVVSRGCPARFEKTEFIQLDTQNASQFGHTFRRCAGRGQDYQVKGLFLTTWA
jgi:hypothetical protein